jgi:hypothetical protein
MLSFLQEFDYTPPGDAFQILSVMGGVTRAPFMMRKMFIAALGQVPSWFKTNASSNRH